MPVKTKAQKVATDLRRESIQYSLPTSQTPVKSREAVAISSDYSYVISDLKRIGIFSLLAFGAEIILWYFLR